MTTAELNELLSKIVVAGTHIRPVVSAEQLLRYAELLSKWTGKMDLVSSSDLNRIIEEHILDSVAAFYSLKEEFDPATPMLDIGSGAGLPGVVFSILSPETPMALIEPRAKRVSFLKEVRRELGLTYEVHQKRLEELTSQELPERKVHGTQRAVGLETQNSEFLRKRAPGSKLSFIVSPQWVCPEELAKSLSARVNYEFLSRRGDVATVRCG